MPKKTLALWDAIEARLDEVKTEFSFELEELKKDMATMEKIVRGKGKNLYCSPDDIIHGAMIVTEKYRMFLEFSRILATATEERDKAAAEDLLQRSGARITRKPAGWSLIDAAGKRTLLGPADDPRKAADKLARVLAEQPETAPIVPEKRSPARERKAAKALAEHGESIGYNPDSEAPSATEKDAPRECPTPPPRAGARLSAAAPAPPVPPVQEELPAPEPMGQAARPKRKAAARAATAGSGSPGAALEIPSPEPVAEPAPEAPKPSARPGRRQNQSIQSEPRQASLLPEPPEEAAPAPSQAPPPKKSRRSRTAARAKAAPMDAAPDAGETPAVADVLADRPDQEKAKPRRTRRTKGKTGNA